MNRRNFLGAMFAAAAAPAVVKAENLMKVIVPKSEIVFPDYMAVFEDVADEWINQAKSIYPRGMNPFFAHIDDFAFIRPDGENGLMVITPNGESTFESFFNPVYESDIVAKLNKIAPVPGPFEMPPPRNRRGLLRL